MRESPLSRPIEFPLDRIRELPWSRLLRYAAAAFVALPVIILAVAGWWDRPIQDDFDYALGAARDGVIGQAITQWHLWGGRYTTVIAEGATANMLGSRLTPGVLLLLMVGGWTVAARLAGLSWRRSVAWGCLITTGSLLLFPNVEEPIFWRCAALGYFLPLALSGWVVASIINPRRGASWLIGTAAIVFVSAGCAEVWSLVLCAALLACCVGWRRYSGTLRLRLLIATASAFSGSALMLLAPGNAKRAATVATHPTLTVALDIALKATVRYFSPSWVVTVFPMLCLLVALAFLAALLVGEEVPVRVQSRTLMIVGLLLPAALFAAVLLCNFPPAYALGCAPDSRTMTIPAFICGIAVMAYGALLGQWLSQKPRLRWVAPVLSVWALYQLSGIIPAMPLTHFYRLQQFAAGMDAREQYIAQQKALGNLDIVVPGVNDTHDITADPSFWVNTEAAHYYGLRSIKLGMPTDRQTPAPRPGPMPSALTHPAQHR